MLPAILPTSLLATHASLVPVALPPRRSLHGTTSFAPPRPPLPPVSALRPPPPTYLPEQAWIASEQLHRPPHSSRQRQPDHDQEDDHAMLDQESLGSRSPEVADKRARRKEQCRVNQANYRKRKRQHERELSGDIVTLEREIKTLMARRNELLLTEQQHSPDEEPEHAIASFYMAMQSQSRESDPTPTNGAPTPTVSESESTPLDLESEQFDSLEEFTDAWRQHQRSFGEIFRLNVLAMERLEAGDHAIVKMTAELEISLPATQVGMEEKAFVLAVQQRFEIDGATGRVSRVTSEVDLVAGLATQHSTETTAAMLQILARR